MKNAGKARNLGPKKEDLTLFGVVMDDVPFFSAGVVGRIQVEITDHEAWQENKGLVKEEWESFLFPKKTSLGNHCNLPK